MKIKFLSEYYFTIWWRWSLLLMFVHYLAHKLLYYWFELSLIGPFNTLNIQDFLPEIFEFNFTNITLNYSYPYFLNLFSIPFFFIIILFTLHQDGNKKDDIFTEDSKKNKEWFVQEIFLNINAVVSFSVGFMLYGGVCSLHKGILFGVLQGIASFILLFIFIFTVLLCIRLIMLSIKGLFKINENVFIPIRKKIRYVFLAEDKL